MQAKPARLCHTTLNLTSVVHPSYMERTAISNYHFPPGLPSHRGSCQLKDAALRQPCRPSTSYEQPKRRTRDFLCSARLNKKEKEQSEFVIDEQELRPWKLLIPSIDEILEDRNWIYKARIHPSFGTCCIVLYENAEASDMCCR